jgi:hypothetical protein
MSDKPNAPAPTPEATQAALIARRRLLRGSLGVAPVLMVSAPRSVMAGTCSTASAWTSATLNTSHAATTVQTNGRLPAHWKGCGPALAQSEWPTTCLIVDGNGVRTDKSQPFNSVFSTSYTAYNGKSLMDVLGQNAASGGNDELAKYVIAALLNARTGKTNCIVDEFTVQTIWTKCATGSFFEPTAGIQWKASWSNSPGSPGGCIAWLKSTMS